MSDSEITRSLTIYCRPTSWMDSRKCQTATATPAEPGEFPLHSAIVLKCPEVVGIRPRILILLVCIKSALLDPRYRKAGHIAGQRNADARERRTEKINLAEHNKTTKRCQSDNEQER